MEATAFVLLQLHETNKHTIKHKETSKRLSLEQNLVFVQNDLKKQCGLCFKSILCALIPGSALHLLCLKTQNILSLNLYSIISVISEAKINKFTAFVCDSGMLLPEKGRRVGSKWAG